MEAKKGVRFTIVMTVRNNAPYVRRSLASILPELGQEGELVIVDAASTDGTTEYLRELESQGRLRLIVQPCTRGMGRHLGIQATEAPIVLTQIDADVEYREGAIREAVDAFDRRGRRQLMVVFPFEDPNPGTVKIFVWDRAYYLSTGGYEDRNLHDDMQLLRKVLAERGAHRHMVQTLGNDLQIRGASIRTRPQGLALAREFVRVARVVHGDGSTYVVYLRFLWLTRRSFARYVAASLLAAIGFLRKPIVLPQEHLNRMTPTDPDS